MKSKKERFFRLLISNSSKVSSKRVIGLSAILIIYLIALVNLFTGKTVVDYVFEGLIWLAIGGVFGIASEKIFGNRNRGYNDNDNGMDGGDDDNGDDSTVVINQGTKNPTPDDNQKE